MNLKKKILLEVVSPQTYEGLFYSLKSKVNNFRITKLTNEQIEDAIEMLKNMKKIKKTINVF